MPIAFPATFWTSSGGGSTAPTPLVYWEADYGVVTTTDGTNPDASPVSGNRVLSWTSKDGTATVASYATNSQRPFYKVPLYGNPYVTFDGSASHRLETTAWNSTFNGASQYTIGMSFRKPAAYSGYRNEVLMAFNTSDVYGMIKAGPGGSGYGMFGGGSSRVYLAYGGELISQGSLFGSFSTTGTSSTAGSSITKLYYNGSLVASDTTTTATTNISDRILLGGTTDPTNSKTKDIYGFYLYNTQLSDSDLLSVHNAIMSRMNVTDIYTPNNSLLLHFDGANGSTTFTDSSSSNYTVTAVANAKISTAQSVFGGGSLALGGSGDRVNSTAGAALGYGSGNFTLEFWIRFNAIPSAQCGLVDAFTTGGFSLYYVGNTAYFGIPVNTLVISNRSVSIKQQLWTPNLNQWYFLAVTRSGTSLDIWINGVKQGTTTTNSTNFSTGTVQIGGTDDGVGWTLNGYMDDIRSTVGVARTIAVPTAPFPNS